MTVGGLYDTAQLIDSSMTVGGIYDTAQLIDSSMRVGGLYDTTQLIDSSMTVGRLYDTAQLIDQKMYCFDIYSRVFQFISCLAVEFFDKKSYCESFGNLNNIFNRHLDHHFVNIQRWRNKIVLHIF